MSKQAISDAIAAYFGHIAAMNPEGWVDYFAVDAVSYDPVGEPPSKVHENFRDFFGLMEASFQKLEAITEDIFIAGNEAAVKWTMRGVSKTGKMIMFDGITVFEFNGAGKIQTTKAYWNPKAMMAQFMS